ncbi:unnamed protein product [Natator depressus]
MRSHWPRFAAPGQWGLREVGQGMCWPPFLPISLEQQTAAKGELNVFHSIILALSFHPPKFLQRVQLQWKHMASARNPCDCEVSGLGPLPTPEGTHPIHPNRTTWVGILRGFPAEFSSMFCCGSGDPFNRTTLLVSVMHNVGDTVAPGMCGLTLLLSSATTVDSLQLFARKRLVFRLVCSENIWMCSSDDIGNTTL